MAELKQNVWRYYSERDDEGRVIQRKVKGNKSQPFSSSLSVGECEEEKKKSGKKELSPIQEYFEEKRK